MLDGTPRGLAERLLALRSFAPLAEAPPAELAMLARLSRERDFFPGESMAKEGEGVQVVRLIVGGQVTLSRRGRSVDIAGPLDTVGLLAVAAGLPHLVSAVASEPVHALEVDADLVDDVLEDDFPLFARVLRLAAVAGLRGAPSAPRPDEPLVASEGVSAKPAVRSAVGMSASFDQAARLLALHRVPLFRSSPIDGLAAFAKRMELVRVAAGETVTLGGTAGAMAVVVSGSVRVVGGMGARDSFPHMSSIPAGNLIGGLQGLSHDRTPLDVRADGQVMLLRGLTSDLLDVLEDHHTMGRRLLGRIIAAGFTGCGGASADS